MKIIVLVWLLVTVALGLPHQTPIIGIYTQTDGSDEPKTETEAASIPSDEGASSHSYIAASYVKFIQISGAQVVPLFAYSNQAYFDNILPKINGVLFPGGDTEININNKWTKNADYILKYAISQNNKGNVFPVWGTCLGMQLLAYLTAGYDSKAIQPVSGEVAIKNTLQIQEGSSLLSDLSNNLKTAIQTSPGIVYFNHHYAVTKNYYDSKAQLRSFWRVAATTTTSAKEVFLSVAEAKDYPFYAVQFHPEKNLFEWKVAADRSDNGAEIVQILSNKFIEAARYSKNSFSNDQDFMSASIYNYNTQPTKMSFTQIYLFDEVTTEQQNTEERQEQQATTTEVHPTMLHSK